MTVESLSELLNWQPPKHYDIISDGILLPETGIVVFGPAKSWKSILAIHTAYCIATGSDWFGFKTKKCTVFKYQVELPKAIDRKRILKYINSTKNGSRPDNLFFKTAPYSKIDTSYGRQALEKDIQVVQQRSPDQHVVLILDPVYLLISGHISDDYDIKKLLDNLNEIKAKLHISVIIVHHTHKTRVDSAGNIIDLGSEEIMGSSYFNNWADTMVQLRLLNPFTGNNQVKMSFALSRHAEKILPAIHMNWNRSSLHPSILKKEIADEEEISIRTLTDD